MDLEKAKTGDRLWTMLPGSTREDRMKSYSDDYILNLHPYEVIYLSNVDHRREDKELLLSRNRCAIIKTGEVETIASQFLFESRNEAIQQTISDIEERIRAFETGCNGYLGMMGEPSDKQINKERLRREQVVLDAARRVMDFSGGASKFTTRGNDLKISIEELTEEGGKNEDS